MGELAAALAVPGQGDAVVGQVDVVEFEVPDGAVACDVVGSQGDDDLNFVACRTRAICRMSDKS